MVQRIVAPMPAALAPSKGGFLTPAAAGHSSRRAVKEKSSYRELLESDEKIISTNILADRLALL